MTSYKAENPFQAILEAIKGRSNPISRSAWRKLRRHYAKRAEADFRMAADALKPGDICLDLGANVGKFSTLLAEKGAEIHAFEPDPYAYKILCSNVNKFKNVIPHNKAVGASGGTLKLFRHKDFDKNPEHYSVATTVALGNVRTDIHEYGEVEVVDFFELIESFGKPLQLVKMDIEGAEWDILDRLFEANSWDNLRALYVETHEHLDTNRIDDVLRFRKLADSVRTCDINLHWQ
ncbi:MAG: FkbM family methyltransferase [Boseongicola sp.]|nr:MAG: FkbM family methyltransferase [Boseongicola sp.]